MRSSDWSSDVCSSDLGSLKRVPGTAIFLNSRVEGVPPALLHNVKHNKILHERVIILTVRTEGVPHLPLTGRSEVTDLGSGFYRVVLRHGFMEEVDIPAAMKEIGSASCRERVCQYV